MIPTFTTLGSGATVLMLHDIDGGHLAFAPQVETLAEVGYRAVAWDMPGYGRSAPIEPYTFKGLAQACVRLIEALQCDSVVLVGHGMGGMVAQEVVARRPDKVRKLVLCGCPDAFSGDADAFVTARLAPLATGLNMAQLAQQRVPQLVGPGALPEGLRLAEHAGAEVPEATYRRALACFTTFDRRADLAHIRVPTLLVAGAFDRETEPARLQAMAAAIPLGRCVEMAGIGHLMPLEAPDRFDGLLLDFLRERAPQPLPGLH